MTRKSQTTSTAPRPTKALSEAQVRKLLDQGRELRRELEQRVRRMHQIDETSAAARAR